MSSKTIRTLFTAVAASLLMIGCGDEESTPDPETPIARSAPGTASKPVEGNTIVQKTDPDGKAMHLTATSPAGKKFQASIGGEVDVPDEFPEDVPIFPGSTPMASLSAPDGFIVTFKSTEEQQVIFDFYKSKLSAGGWEIVENAMGGNQLTIDASKDDRTVSVIVAGRTGDSRVSVIITHPN
jgi:hypothetical protein